MMLPLIPWLFSRSVERLARSRNPGAWVLLWWALVMILIMIGLGLHQIFTVHFDGHLVPLGHGR